jgi:hypothetical protein
VRYLPCRSSPAWATCGSQTLAAASRRHPSGPSGSRAAARKATSWPCLPLSPAGSGERGGVARRCGPFTAAARVQPPDPGASWSDLGLARWEKLASFGLATSGQAVALVAMVEYSGAAAGRQRRPSL